jgi:hypothetical protein
MSNRNLVALVLACIGFDLIGLGFVWAIGMATLDDHRVLILSGALLVIVAIFYHKMDLS